MAARYPVDWSSYLPILPDVSLLMSEYVLKYLLVCFFLLPVLWVLYGPTIQLSVFFPHRGTLPSPDVYLSMFHKRERRSVAACPTVIWMCLLLLLYEMILDRSYCKLQITCMLSYLAIKADSDSLWLRPQIFSLQSGINYPHSGSPYQEMTKYITETFSFIF